MSPLSPLEPYLDPEDVPGGLKARLKEAGELFSEAFEDGGKLPFSSFPNALHSSPSGAFTTDLGIPTRVAENIDGIVEDDTPCFHVGESVRGLRARESFVVFDDKEVCSFFRVEDTIHVRFQICYQKDVDRPFFRISVSNCDPVYDYTFYNRSPDVIKAWLVWRILGSFACTTDGIRRPDDIGEMKTAFVAVKHSKLLRSATDRLPNVFKRQKL